jgi:diguanylate cyclase (GGDEF)-like protein/PAS domain S-box-containing protein
VARALERSTIAKLAEAIAADDHAALPRLFQAAKARPPLVVWGPDPATLRSPVLVRLEMAWRRALGPAGSLPPADAARTLVEGRDGDWTMLVAPAARPDAASVESHRNVWEATSRSPPLGRLVYHHYGAGIARHYGRDMTGQSMAAFPGHIGTFFAAVYEAVRLRAEPIFTEHEPPATVLVRSWRRLVLPFADPLGAVGGFIVGNIPESAVGALLDVMYDAALVVDGSGLIRLANRAASELLSGHGPPLEGSLLDGHLPDLTATMQRLIEQVDGVGALGRQELALTTRDGRAILEVSIGGTRVDGQPLFVLVLRDLTERAEREQALESIAFRDELTGVLNRRGLRQHVGAESPRPRRRALRQQDRYGLLIIDLDGFKTLNDTHGHAVGDAVLSSVARRISGVLRGDDVVARWGGDEFVVLVHGVTRPADLGAAAAKLLAVLAPPHAVGGRALRLSVSIGGALYSGHGSGLDAVFAAADTALYAAKSAGGDCLQLAPDAAGDA